MQPAAAAKTRAVDVQVHHPATAYRDLVTRVLVPGRAERRKLIGQTERRGQD